MTKYFFKALHFLILISLIPITSAAFHDPILDKPDPYFSKIEIENLSPALEADGSSSYIVKMTLKNGLNQPISGLRPTIDSNVLGDFISQPLRSSDENGVTRASIAALTAYNHLKVPRVLSFSNIANLEYVTTLARFNPGAPKQLGFIIQPLNSPSGGRGLNTLEIAIQDQFGNTVEQNQYGYISLALINNTSGAKLTGSTSAQIVNGIAVFEDLGISKIGNGYKLIAFRNGLIEVQSNNFNIQ